MQDIILTEFTAGLDPMFADIVEHIVKVIRSAPRPLDSAVKWKQLTFADNSDFHHWICAIAVTRKCVALRFHFGGLLEDPGKHLLAGSSKFLRTLEFRTMAGVDDGVILDFVNQAQNKLQFFKNNWKAIQTGTFTS